MGFLGKSVLVTLVALLCFISSTLTEEVNHVTHTLSYVPAPSPYNHGHHHPHHPYHHHPHPHSHPPAPYPYHHGHHHPHPPHHHHPHPHSHPPALSPYHHGHRHPPPLHHHHPHPSAKSLVKPPVSPPTKSQGKSPVKPPVSPPAKSPVKPPVSPSAKSPMMPPVYPPKYNKTLVAVQGTVYCKSCKYASSDNSLLGAKPVQGAAVRLLCKSKKRIEAKTKTDKNGDFLLLGPKTLTNHGFRACRVYLVKSKDSKVSKLHHGSVGAVLKLVKTPGKSAVVINKLVYGLFQVGPFAFDPFCPK